MTLIIGAESRGRTGTGAKSQQILSLLRLPVPPYPHKTVDAPIIHKKSAESSIFSSLYQNIYFQLRNAKTLWTYSQDL